MICSRSHKANTKDEVNRPRRWPQCERFKCLTRETRTDMNAGAFERALEKVVPQKKPNLLRLAFAVFAASFVAGRAMAQSSVPGGFYAYGYGGGISCATWLSSPSSEQTGREWLLGYWTGMNAAAARGGSHNGGVGESTDVNGIVGEVRLVCEQEPSRSLIAATQDVFLRFRREGR